MTNRNRRSRSIAAAVLAFAFLAIVAWWRFTTASPAMTAPAAGNALTAISPAALPGVVADSTKTPPPAGNATGEGGGTSALQTCDRDFKRNLRGYLDQLDAARSPDEAIDRLLLDFLANDPAEWMSEEAGSGYRAASKRWPENLDLAWLSFDTCNEGCDRGAELKRLLSRDPDNAAAWMAAMGEARQRKDDDGFDIALKQATEAKIYDSRMGIAFLHLRKTLADVPQPDSCRTPQWKSEMQRDLGRAPTDSDHLDGMAGAVEMAIALPSFAGLFGCKDTTFPLAGARRALCISLLSRVVAGDTLVEQMVADTLLIGLQRDPGQTAGLRERYRQLRWLMSMAQEKPFPQDYFARIYSDGEVATLQSIAIERHQWPPPADWLPDDERGRALITGVPTPN